MDLSKLLLAELVQAQNKQGVALVIPYTQLIHNSSEQDYQKYMELIQGIAVENTEEIWSNLEEISLLPAAGSMDHHPTNRV